jgi:hypothetical protein
MYAYSIGAISFEKARDSAICYMGMCKNCNGYNMTRWIEENFVLKRSDEAFFENNDSPKERHFYSIHENDDGTVDVYLRPDVLPMKAEHDQIDYDVAVLVVKNVEPFDEMEEDIRARYTDWCDSAEVIYL